MAQDWTLNVVGESYRNTDGSHRQAEIMRCCPGESVALRREPENPHDRDAVAVLSVRGVQVGYLSAEHARWIGGKLDRGADVRAIIERVTGGTADKPSRGVCVRINLEGQAPELPKQGWLARVFGLYCGNQLTVDASRDS